MPLYREKINEILRFKMHQIWHMSLGMTILRRKFSWLNCHTKTYELNLMYSMRNGSLIPQNQEVKVLKFFAA